MRHFEKNPRKISKKELQQLRADLRELGDLGGFVHNLETDEIVGGNQRSEAIPGILSGKLTPVITQTYDPPNAQGTVSEGYFEWEGERFKYRAVRWDAATARRANIRANKAGGVWDFDTLAQWDFDELKGWGFDADFMQHLETGAAWLLPLLARESVMDTAEAFGKLPDEDRAPFQQMTFTLHDSQAEIVKDALRVAQALGDFIDSPNENSNGNALARICELFLMTHDHG